MERPCASKAKVRKLASRKGKASVRQRDKSQRWVDSDAIRLLWRRVSTTKANLPMEPTKAPWAHPPARQVEANQVLLRMLRSGITPMQACRTADRLTISLALQVPQAISEKQGDRWTWLSGQYRRCLNQSVCPAQRNLDLQSERSPAPLNCRHS